MEPGQYDKLKEDIKSFEKMYPDGPMKTVLQSARLAIIDLEDEIKQLKAKDAL